MAEGDSGIWLPPGGSADPRRVQPQTEPEPGPPAREPTDEELLAGIRRLRVADVVVSAMSTLAQLAYAKLDEEARDTEQARLAIDALRALLPVVEGSVAPEVVRDFGQVVTNLQLAYASAVQPPQP